MKLEDWIKSHRNSRSIVAPAMSAAEAQDILVTEILGNDWMIPYSCNGEQAMAEVVAAVVKEVQKLKTPWWKKLLGS